jgi:hypothetical protein
LYAVISAQFDSSDGTASRMRRSMGPRVGFGIEVVGDLRTGSPAFAAQYLPAGLGADQVDIAAAHAVPPIEPVLYPLRHRCTLEHVYYRPQAI